MRMKTMATCVLLLMTMAWVSPIDAQVRGTRRRAVVKGEEGKGAVVGRRGAVVKTEEGYAAASRRGTRQFPPLPRRPTDRVGAIAADQRAT